jgi:glycosyltransferase involved in cell wall biosynthesis
MAYMNTRYNKVLLVLPFAPWDENENGISKVIFNLLRFSKRTQYTIIVHDANSDVCIPLGFKDMIQDVIYVPNKKKRNYKTLLMSLFHKATYEEQMCSSDAKALGLLINKELGDNDYDCLHFVSSSFTSIFIDFEIKVLHSFIDNKVIYYQRKLNNTKNVTRLYTMYQLVKMKAFYSNLNVDHTYHFVSSLDGKKFNSNLRTIIIENGVKLPQSSTIKDFGTKCAYFHGNFSYEPNIIAFNKICEIARLEDMEDVKFIIFGLESENLQGKCKNVIKLGPVENVSDNLPYGGVYFSPIEVGSGIKNKILEALSMGMIVVGTETSFDSIDTHKIGCKVVDTASIKATVNALKEVLAMADKRQEMANKNKIFSKKEFAWELKVESYESFYENDN